MLADPAGHDAPEVGQVGFDVQADPVEAHPFADLHADGGDLVLTRPSGTLALHPDADAALADVRLYPEPAQGSDQPRLQTTHEGAHVAAAGAEIQHDVGHALAGAVIGELAAAAGAMHGEPGIQ